MEKKRRRIKINDLPKDMKITKDELKRVKGGVLSSFLKIDGQSTSIDYGRIQYPSTFVGIKIE
jgi:hypothetical protein